MIWTYMDHFDSGVSFSCLPQPKDAKDRNRLCCRLVLGACGSLVEGKGGGCSGRGPWKWSDCFMVLWWFGITIINRPLSMVYANYLLWFGGWFLIVIITQKKLWWISFNMVHHENWLTIGYLFGVPFGILDERAPRNRFVTYNNPYTVNNPYFILCI